MTPDADKTNTEPIAPPLVSVIMPTLNEAGVIADTLAPLQLARQQGWQVIVVDGGSRDQTRALAEPLCDVLLESAPGRARQMNRGAELASGAILWFLHADTGIQPGCIDSLQAVDGAQVMSWGRFEVRLDAPGLIYRIIERGINRRARLTGLATGDQGIFVSRNIFRRVGGYPEVPIMEDLELTRSLREQAAIIHLKPPLLTSARRWQKHGVLRTVLLMWWLRLRWWLGASPHRLARHYQNHREGESS